MKEKLTKAQVGAYLERLGYALGDHAQPSREALDELVFVHQCAVPFETYCVNVQGLTPNLALDELFEKIIVRKRGGYCFELNKLFEALLVALGYDARPVLCRAVERTGRSPINHRGVLVSFGDMDCFVDVGYGGPMPAGILPMLDDEEQEIRGDLFFTRRVDETWWAVDRVTKAKADFFDDDIPSRRQTELEFCLSEVEDFDFDLLNVALSQPGTLFRDHLLANIRTECGHIALTDTMLVIRDNGEKNVRELGDEEAVAQALADYFGVVY